MLPKKFRFISSAALIVVGLIIAVVVLTRHGRSQRRTSHQ